MISRSGDTAQMATLLQYLHSRLAPDNFCEQTSEAKPGNNVGRLKQQF